MLLLKRINKQRNNFARMQSGTVLITVLLVVSFVVVLLIEVDKTVTYQSNLNRNLMNRDQAYSYLMGMEEMSKIQLKRLFDLQKDERVHLGQLWAKQEFTFPIDGGVMSATIIDMQSCFNLNSITVADKQETNAQVDQLNQPDVKKNKKTIGEKIFRLLLDELLDDRNQSIALTASTKDWLDVDSTPSGPDGVEDHYYQGLNEPYLPPNGPIAHVSELRLVKSFNNKNYKKIRDFVCVLPNGEDYKLNVNTITKERVDLLYAALDGKVKKSEINSVISDRPEKGYKIEEFWDKIGTDIKINKKFKQRLDITSRFFQLKAKAKINNTSVYMKTLLEKQQNNQFKVVSRYFGKE